jgi:putative DNA primase/helicase
VRRLADGTLCVPLRDAELKLWNLQTIAPAAPADGGPEKRFLKGGRKSGLWHWIIGDPRDLSLFVICEGYATGASIHEATGRTVAVAFDAGNLAHVVRALRGQHPAARLAVAGDDDRDTEARTGKNPGRLKATEAARLAQGPAIFPPADALPAGGSDFNDLHAAAGLEAVRAAIEGALQAAEAAGGASTPAGRKKSPPAARQQAPRGDGDEAAGGAASWDRFRVDDAGLWFDAPADDGGGKAAPVRVCGPLQVAALARDTHDTGAALLLEFDAFGKPRRWLMPLEMLAGDGTAYRAALLNQGFIVPTDAKRRGLLTAYLQSRRPAELVRIVDRTGWHGRAFVMPRETLGGDDGERILFQSEGPTENAFGQRGSLAQWHERIGRLCLGNSRLTFAVSCAFAGPLLAWAAGTDGGGFHFVGDSSSGKTTALRCAASVWGSRDYLARWRATSNGIEALAAQHSDGLLCLDELAQLDPKEAGEAAYLLANGAGKTRADRSGKARARLTWRLLFVSAGEIGLSDHMAEANRRPRAGQELRMIDLPADAGAGRGIFETLHEFDSGGALAQHLTRAAETTYGSPGRAWLLHLTANTEGLSATLRDRMDRAEGRFVPETASGQVQRVGRRFALVAAAGELATDAGLTGWPPGTATDAAQRVMNAWIEGRPGGIGLSEDAAIMRQLRQWFGAHGEARFTDWSRADDDHAPKTMNRAGWRRAIKTAQGLEELTGWEWFILPDVFRAEVCKGYSERAALRLLKEREHLHTEPGRGGYTCKARPPGADGVMVYRVRSSLLGDVDE